MQTVKDHIKSDILQSAATLFLEKGYLKVPMREIAHKSGVGLSNIYNYFSCKDDIFVQIVAPAVRTFENMLDEHHGRRGTDIMSMCDRDYFKHMVDEYTSFIHRHRDLLLLLLFRSQGSSLENYKEEFARKSTVLVKEYFTLMKHKHPQLETDISDFSIRMHTVWMFALFEELLMRRVKPDETEKVVTEYMTIEVAGWRELMKI